MSLKPKIELRQHQQAALDFLEDAKGKALFAHGTGTGKTLSAIAAMEKQREENKIKKTLVVTPASLKNNFLEQGIKNFTAGVNAIDGIDGKSEYQVVSFSKFRKNPEKIWKDSNADSMIVDEVHRAKDPNSQTYKSLREIAKSDKMKSFLGLTGSFISNHPKEVVPLMDLVSPGHSLGSQQAFSRKHVKTKYERGGFLRKAKRDINLQQEKILNKAIKNNLHYVDHRDMGKDLPRVRSEDIYVDMSPEQNKNYQYALKRLSPSARKKLQQGLPVNKQEMSHIFSMITSARQASNSLTPFSTSISPAESAERVPKLKRVMDDVEKHLKENRDGQAVVYSNFNTSGANDLVEGLKSRGLSVGEFTGSNTKTRHRDVEDFKKSKKNVIVLSPAAAEGVSLNNATAFFEVDRHYNPERNEQAIARGRRLGGLSHRKPEDRVLEVKRYFSQPQKTFVQKLLRTKEVGVDEWIDGIAKEKQKLNDQMRQVAKGTMSISDVKHANENPSNALQARAWGKPTPASREAVSNLCSTGRNLLDRYKNKKEGQKKMSQEKFEQGFADACVKIAQERGTSPEEVQQRLLGWGSTPALSGLAAATMPVGGMWAGVAGGALHGGEGRRLEGALRGAGGNLGGSIVGGATGGLLAHALGKYRGLSPEMIRQGTRSAAIGMGRVGAGIGTYLGLRGMHKNTEE